MVPVVDVVVVVVVVSAVVVDVVVAAVVVVVMVVVVPRSVVVSDICECTTVVGSVPSFKGTGVFVVVALAAGDGDVFVEELVATISLSTQPHVVAAMKIEIPRRIKKSCG